MSKTIDVSVERPDQSVMLANAESTHSLISSMEIDSPEAYAMAADELKQVKAVIVNMEDFKKKLLQPFTDGAKTVRDLLDPIIGRYKEAETALKQKQIAYMVEQQRKADEEKRAAEQAAAAERDRLLREAAARKEEAGRELASVADSEIPAAAQVRVQAAQEEAQALELQAALVVAPPTVTVVPKVKGQSVRYRIEVQVTDLWALIQHVAKDEQLKHLLEENITGLRKLAEAQGDMFNMPGVTVRKVPVLASRTA